MPNEEHLAILQQGVRVWNKWKQTYDPYKEEGIDLTGASLVAADLRNADLKWVDLSGANLSGANLSGADLTGVELDACDLTGADLTEARLIRVTLVDSVLHKTKLIRAKLNNADLSRADMMEANLTGAYLHEAILTNTDLSWAKLNDADLSLANLSGAVLIGANLSGANLTRTNLIGANLIETNLSGAKLIQTVMVQTTLVRTNFRDATLEQCSIYGISVWNVDLEGAKQRGLNISPLGETEITVDDLEVAQFIYLLLNNSKLRNVIDTIGNKAVLILGRFSIVERKAVLDALRDALRERDYLPIVFDFVGPSSRNATETVRILAHLSRFIIADLTEPSSVPHEISQFAPLLPSVPVKPLILEGHRPFAMFEDGYEAYDWVLPKLTYKSLESLIEELDEKVIQPAEQKANEQRPKPLS